MALPLPIPPTPPSAAGRRIIGELEKLIAKEPTTPAEHEQRVVDLMHIFGVVRQAIPAAMATAVDLNNPTKTSVRRLQSKTGLAKSAVQDRVRRYNEATAPPAQRAATA